ncbi:MAG: YbaN family protein [Myxococcales bacterium]|nr:YbaN family protein [Myxococcales bacterium]
MEAPAQPPTDAPPLLRLVSARQRWLYQAVGIIFVVIGAIGALLPVMPTTPFLLISLWAFDRSSPRLHAWLWYHRWFGPGLRRWHRERTIAPWVKVFAIASMLTSTAYATWGLRPHLG